LSCRYLRQYTELGHEIMGLPLSRVERAALDLFDSLTHRADLRLDMMLEPGDLQFANNYAVLHSRTAFEDDPDPAVRRRMVRLWVKMPNARALAPEFPGRNGFPAPAAVVG
jgi:alpha-ketoglutarate-dependent taurine dioxygenase